MTLKSRSELLPEQSKMDLMDVNQVLEVPDTPDRLVSSATHDSECNERRINASTINQKTSMNCINGRIRNQQMENGKSVIGNGSRRLLIHPNSSSSFKSPRSHVDITKHDKGKSLCNSDAQKKFTTHQEGGSFAGVIIQDGHEHSGISRVNPSRKGVLSLKTCKLNRTSGSGKGVDFLDAAHHKSENNAPCTSSKVPQRKMLVRNGCISPHNIAKSKHAAKKHENVNLVNEVESGFGSNTLGSESQSNMVNIKDLVSEPKDSHRCKEKGVLHYHSSSKEPNAESSHLPPRRTIHKEPSTELEGWRTTHNHRKERDIEQQRNGMIRMQRDHRNEKDIIILDESEIVSSSMSPHTHIMGVNRQKEATLSRNLGKRSVSVSIVDDEIGETSSSRSKRSKNVNGVGPSNPVVEPITRNNEDSSVRALQVEADEMLARELQEQLYNEELTPALDIDEMDSHVAFAIAAQRDSRSRHAGGRRQAPSASNPRARSQPNTSTQRRGQPQARASTRMSQLRSRFRSRPPTISSNSNQRNSIFPPNMDVDMRMQILETLEAVGDMRRPNGVLPLGREFTEDDYEMLLALDDNNHRHGGATRAQINNLPESKVQAENLQECSICLEVPAIGETIRHLPCLHRFHKACIDEWLRRKTSCPICKSSIT